MQLVHAQKPVVARDRLLRLPEVVAMTGASKTSDLRPDEGRQISPINPHYPPYGGLE